MTIETGKRYHSPSPSTSDRKEKESEPDLIDFFRFDGGDSTQRKVPLGEDNGPRFIVLLTLTNFFLVDVFLEILSKVVVLTHTISQ